MIKILLAFLCALALGSCTLVNKNSPMQVSGDSKNKTVAITDSGETGTQLKILNYNIRTRIPLMTKNPDAWIQKVVAAIVRFDPDIAGLVEVEESIEGLDNIPAEIDRRLNESGYEHYSHYEVRFNQISIDGNLGMMLISKVPIKDYLGYRPQYVKNTQNKDKDLIASFTYEKDDIKFRFFSYHPHPGATAEESVHFLVEHVQNSTDTGLKFISGDFNQELTSPYMKKLLTLYRNAGDESPDKSCEYTYDRTLTENNPPDKGVAIDHIMINKDAPVNVKVVKVHCDHDANKGIPVSDHFPVYGIFSIE